MSNHTHNPVPSSALMSPQLIKSRQMITVAYYVTFIAIGMVVASLGPTLSRLAENTQTAISQISLLFTAKALGFILGSLLGGYLYDRVTGHPVMAGMVVLVALGLAFVPLISTFWLLILLIFLIGLVDAVIDVGGNTLLVWLHRDKVEPYMNALHFFFGVGAALSPVIFAQALRLTDDITWGYWVLALLTFPVSFWLVRLPSPEAPKKTEDVPYRPVEPYLLGLLIVLFFLFVSAEASFGGWIATYVFRSDLADEAYAADLTFAFWATLTVGRLLSIPIAMRFHVKQILAADLLLCLAGVSLILLWPQTLVMIWVGTSLFGLGVASMFPIGISITEKHMTVSGRITSFLFVGGALGGMSTPWLIGQLFDVYGPLSVMWVILAVVISAIGVYILLSSVGPRDGADLRGSRTIERHRAGGAGSV
ncbi:MAG: MFS transporter, partial [Chloroflexota bacterium]